MRPKKVLHSQLEQREHPFLNYNFSVLLKRSFIAPVFYNLTNVPNCYNLFQLRIGRALYRLSIFLTKKLSTSYSQFTQIEWLNIM